MKKLKTVDDVAIIFGLTKENVLDLVKCGELIGVKIGCGEGEWRFQGKDLRRYLKKQRLKAEIPVNVSEVLPVLDKPAIVSEITEVADEKPKDFRSRMLELRIEGKTYKVIADILNNEGFKPPRAEKFTESIVQRYMDEIKKETY